MCQIRFPILGEKQTKTLLQAGHTAVSKQLQLHFTTATHLESLRTGKWASNTKPKSIF